MTRLEALVNINSNFKIHPSCHFRPYECRDCGKAYKDSASFKRHRLVHSGERPHPCNICPETFIDSKSLKRHREMSHPSEPGDEEEELIEPGHEEQFIPETVIKEEVVGGGGAKVYEDDLASSEGDLEIAETSADSGINSSLDLSVNQSLL